MLKAKKPSMIQEHEFHEKVNKIWTQTNNMQKHFVHEIYNL